MNCFCFHSEGGAGHHTRGTLGYTSGGERRAKRRGPREGAFDHPPRHPQCMAKDNPSHSRPTLPGLVVLHLCFQMLDQLWRPHSRTCCGQTTSLCQGVTSTVHYGPEKWNVYRPPMAKPVPSSLSQERPAQKKQLGFLHSVR